MFRYSGILLFLTVAEGHRRQIFNTSTTDVIFQTFYVLKEEAENVMFASGVAKSRGRTANHV